MTRAIERPRRPDVRQKNAAWYGWPAVLLLLGAIGAACYWNSLANQFLFDDVVNIAQNRALDDLSHVPAFFTQPDRALGGDRKSQFYRPLVSTTFALDHFFWKLNPAGYHATNIFLHVLVSFLFFLVVRGLVPDPRIALVCALLFVSHPVHTEAVTYVAGRADPLSTVFLLLTLLAWRFAVASSGARYFCYIAAGVCCTALGLFSKELAVIFPVLVVFYTYCFAAEEASSPSSRKRSMAFQLALFGVVLVWFLWRNHLLPAVAMQSETFPWRVRLITVPLLVWHYVRILAAPFDLHFGGFRPSYPSSLFQDEYFPPFLFLVGMMGFMAYLRRKARVSAPHRIMFFGLGWFLAALVPYLNVAFPLNALFAEHWVYVPSLGFILFVVSAAVYYAGGKESARRVLGVFAAAIVAGFAWLTVQQNRVWKDPVTFYEYTIRHYPYNEMVFNNLGMEYVRRGEYLKAKEMFERALAIAPGMDTAEGNLRAVLQDIRRKGLELPRK